jgi:hypothetical protein
MPRWQLAQPFGLAGSCGEWQSVQRSWPLARFEASVTW